MGTVIHVDFRRSDYESGDELLDCITVGGKHSIIVPQEDGNWPPFAIVQASHIINRDPSRQLVDMAMLLRLAAQPQIRETPKDRKWCSCCGEWVSVRGFSPDTRNRDGLQSHCKTCRNDHARRMYAMQKDLRNAA